MTDGETGIPVRLVVDEARCIGAGQCEMLEEETFIVDDDTVIARVIGTGLLPLDRAERVVDQCPAQAIAIETAHDGSGPTGEADE